MRKVLLTRMDDSTCLDLLMVNSYVMAKQVFSRSLEWEINPKRSKRQAKFKRAVLEL